MLESHNSNRINRYKRLFCFGYQRNVMKRLEGSIRKFIYHLMSWISFHEWLWNLIFSIHDACTMGNSQTRKSSSACCAWRKRCQLFSMSRAMKTIDGKNLSAWNWKIEWTWKRDVQRTSFSLRTSLNESQRKMKQKSLRLCSKVWTSYFVPVTENRNASENEIVQLCFSHSLSCSK